MKIFFLVMLISVLSSFIYLYLKSRNLYKNAIFQLDEKEYSVKKLIPVGLYFMELIKYKYTGIYDRNLYKKVVQLKGKNNARFFRLIHWAEKVVYVYITLIILLFFGLYIEVDLVMIIFAIFLIIASAFGKDKELDNKINKKYFDIRIEFPEFINKFSLLVGAGLTTNEAFRRIAIECEELHPLYAEIIKVQKEVDMGISFNVALENLAIRIKMKAISRFVSTVIQNNIKGNQNLILELDRQANEAFETRGREIQMLGERINSKLLFPMMIMLVAIMIILAIPAFIILSGSV